MTNQDPMDEALRDAGRTGIPDLVGAAAVETAADGGLRLVGSVCRACGLRTVPPAAVCPGCGSEAVAREIQPSEGVVYSLTTLHVGPRKWGRPFTLGYVDLANGVRVLAALHGEGHAIGRPVRLSWGRVGQDADGTPVHNFVFVPQEARS
ncbi:Zn-ribbon domain-containing OB-fold protein [Salinarimonas sp. NSM]|uniref:Zn-ribbon domain-containing OB-fold protein n=1 Tax=Salinarimonas sp. NSM TaxID=3458003 RepID=UPI0040350080